MMQDQEKARTYIAIDLKSFYASVECRELGFDPLTTNLVVADRERTEKTICLAVSPSLKAYGIPGRARLFEVVQKVREINASRKTSAPGQKLIGKSSNADELAKNLSLAVDYEVAVPRMALYMDYSTRIYNIYLKYIAPEDIHVYSIDEVFMDVTDYLHTYRMTPRELATAMVHEVLRETGITATAGIGTNLYLAKVAMDIVAKHIQGDSKGVRIAKLDEMSYRKLLWSHEPLTDFWRVGHGYARKLAQHGLYTMGDIARCSVGKPSDFHNEELLYKLFGVNAELLIDHAWGWEPCTIAEIKAYKPENNSTGSGQVLKEPYEFEKAEIIVREMTELLTLDLVEKGLVTDQMVLTVGYDIENLSDEKRRNAYHGEVTVDHYGRRVPKHAHGTANLSHFTASTSLIVDAVVRLYQEIVDPALLVRRVYVTANHVVPEESVQREQTYEQLSLFTDYEEQEKTEQEKQREDEEKKMQQAVLAIQKKYGKNAILKGVNLKDGAMTRERNNQIGGHRA